MVVPATVVNHRVPHKGDYTLFADYENLESVCKDCHDAAIQGDERRGFSTEIGPDGWPVDSAHPVHTGERRIKWGYSIPRGCKPSGVPVTLVCGPPAAGKTTYVHAHRAEHDTVIDFDDCLLRIGGVPWDTRHEFKSRALAYRDAMIRGLESKRSGRAWLIVGAPTEDERMTWQKALGDVTVVVLPTPKDECLRRIDSDPRRQHAAGELKDAVRRWWKKSERNLNEGEKLNKLNGR